MGKKDERKSETSHSSKKHKSDKKHRSSASSSKHSRIIDDAVNGEEEFEWAEKQPTMERESVQSIPTSQSMGITAAPSASKREDWLGMGSRANEPKPVSGDTVSTFDPRAGGRDPTMRMEQAVDALDGHGDDFFGSLGQSRIRKDTDKKAPDPDKVGSLIHSKHVAPYNVVLVRSKCLDMN